MGNLRYQKIQVIRTWSEDSDVQTIPITDYDEIYPVTVYDAVHRTMDKESSSLSSELQSIYNLIAEKQEIIFGGTVGSLMTWTSSKGVIGETEISRVIPADPTERSYLKVASEKAVGTELDLKVDASVYNSHARSNDIHTTAAEKYVWNNMTPISDFRDHTSDVDSHITSAERISWNAKANQEDFEAHITNKLNPHSVTAHQIGAYTRSEIDDLFNNIRNSFFNYRNISYDTRKDIATLVEYDPDNWNPNYVLAYGDELPDIPDGSTGNTFFALRPVTDYSINETQNCAIWIKKPASAWRSVGIVVMEAGDMVIRYPDTTLCVWVQGRFINLFTESSAIGSSSGDGISGGAYAWKPVVKEIDGIRYLSFVRSAETEVPDMIDISGTPGYTPIKGIDYFDGASGLGVPSGGNINDIMIKSSTEDYDVEWVPFSNYLTMYVDEGGSIPGVVQYWTDIPDRPQIHQSTGDNENGLMSQKAITELLNEVNEEINNINNRLNDDSSITGLSEIINNHINDFHNPHNITPEYIGATSNNDFLNHTHNQMNPHNVTAEQVGLGNVDNTRDIDKPISNQMKAALDNINNSIDQINATVNGDSLVSRVTWNASESKLTFIYRDESEQSFVIPIVDILQKLCCCNFV